MMLRNRATLTCLAAIATAALAACEDADQSVSGEQDARQIERGAEDASDAPGRETLPARPVGRYAPRDECRDVPGASEFLSNLERAVESRDADAVVALARDDIYLDFGGGSGKAALRERLADEEYNLWGALDELMELGCASNEYGLTLPWYFVQEIDPMHDAYGSYVVTGNDVPLYGTRDGDVVLRTLDWDMVILVAYLETIEDDWEAPRRFVQMEDGTRGYVAADQLRSLIDYRIGVVREDSRWRIQNFIAGD